MLRAFASITGLPWTLLLAGGGTDPERAECIELAGRLGDRVTIAGPLRQDKFATALSRANLFILPSLYEGLPLVLPEALASGCICLATDLPGVRDILGIAGNDWLRLIPCPPLQGEIRHRHCCNAAGRIDGPLRRTAFAGIVQGTRGTAEKLYLAGRVPKDGAGLPHSCRQNIPVNR